MDLRPLGGWQDLLADALSAPWFAELDARVTAAYAAGPVYPPEADLFSAFALTQPAQVRAVILGQDPYHEPGQAHGLSFSVRPGTPLPPSLRNIYKELESDLGIPPAENGCLEGWARQGVLLLNTVLTVEAGQAGSHASLGWQAFTDAAAAAIAALPQPVAAVLWGKQAAAKAPVFAASAYPRLVLCAAHPSPLSARRGFFGSRPFSQVNAFLAENGAEPIDWSRHDCET